MKFTVGIKVDAVVATANPIAVVIDQRDIERKEFQRAINIENWLELFGELIDGGLVENLAQLHQRVP